MCAGSLLDSTPPVQVTRSQHQSSHSKQQQQHQHNPQVKDNSLELRPRCQTPRHRRSEHRRHRLRQPASAASMARTRRVGARERAAELRWPLACAAQLLLPPPPLLLALAAAAAAARQRKKRTHQEEGTDPSKKAEPRTFVFRRGKHWVRTTRRRLSSAAVA